MKIAKILISTMILAQVLSAKYNPTPRKIVRMHNYNGSVVFKLEGGAKIDKGKCKNDYYYTIESSKDNGNLYSSLLAAYMSGKKVRIGYTPSVCSNAWGKDGTVSVYGVLFEQ